MISYLIDCARNAVQCNQQNPDTLVQERDKPSPLIALTSDLRRFHMIRAVLAVVLGSKLRSHLERCRQGGGGRF